MSFKLASVESFSFDGESFGTAGAAALRKVRSLAESAPKGRLFAAIATLTEMSSSAASALDNREPGKAKHIARRLADAGETHVPELMRKNA